MQRQSSKSQVVASVTQEEDSEKLPQNSNMILKVTDNSWKIQRVACPPSPLEEVIPRQTKTLLVPNLGPKPDAK